MKFKNILIYLILPFLVISCWPREMEETINLLINNGLDNRVELKFFKNGLPSGKKSISKLGKGEIFSDGDTDTVVLINEILQADSIVMIFDNERRETHMLLTNQPMDHNLFNYDSYEITGDTYTYTIDEKNYNNAIPCDGPCY